MAAPILKIAAVVRWRNTIARTYPAMAAFAAASGIRSIVLFLLGTRSPVYSMIYSYSTVPMLALEVISIANVFSVMTESFPRTRKAGILTMAGVFGGSAALAWFLRSYGVPLHWTGAVEFSFTLQRNVSFVLVVILAMARWFLPGRQALRRSALRAADIFTIHLLLTFIGSVYGMATGAHNAVVSYWVAISAGLSLGVLWLLWLTPKSDAYERPLVSDEEWERYRETAGYLRDPGQLINRAEARATQPFTWSDRPKNL
jgi:hypothetical protein